MGYEPQRSQHGISNAFLWGGLALVIISLGACGVGCVSAIEESFAETAEEAEAAGAVAGPAIVLGAIGLVLGMASMFIGAIKRAAGK